MGIYKKMADGLTIRHLHLAMTLHCHHNILQTELLADILRNSVLVNDDVHSLVTNERL